VDANFSDIVNSNDDERLDGAGEDEIVGGVADVPIHSGNEGGCAIEKILAVVHIQDREAALRLLVIVRWQINDEVALIAKETRAKFFVSVKFGCAHGTIITSRSLASTCWPGATKSLVTRPVMGA